MGDLPHDLALRNADPTNWTWSPERRKKYQPAPEVWRTFRETWYGKEDKPTSPLLSLDPDVLTRNAVSSIYIRESYLEMFETVWTQAKIREGEGGVIITGQPGIGKTLFLYYLLVRLLQLKQVILFSPTGKQIYLFYHDGVYQLKGDKDDDYTIPKPTSGAFIWSLFDILAEAEPPSVLVNRTRFAVQTASPNPIRYRLWSKYSDVHTTGLPLWTVEELVEGLKCQSEYPDLTVALESFCSNDSGNPLAPFPGADTLLEEGFANGKPTPEDALKFLLDEAIDRFGYSASDVFSAVFNYTQTTEEHLSAFRLNISQLKSLVTNLGDNENSLNPSSDPILANSPEDRGPYLDVRWKLDFKSDWVSKSINERLTEVEKREIAHTITYFPSMPETQGLARRFFEPVAHRQIVETVAANGDSWKLSVMASDKLDARHFRIAPDEPVPAGVTLAKVGREVVYIRSIYELCPSNNTYYIPPGSTFPFIDSFAIELDFTTRSGVLWAFQITTSRRRGGSRTGYEQVRKIIEKMKEKLQERRHGEEAPVKKIKITPSVEVRYVLVVPECDREVVTDWDFPPGWDENRKVHDHRGNVYRLELPLID